MTWTESPADILWHCVVGRKNAVMVDRPLGPISISTNMKMLGHGARQCIVPEPSTVIGTPTTSSGTLVIEREALFDLAVIAGGWPLDGFV